MIEDDQEPRAVGLLDDYLKIRRKHNQGLTVAQKFTLEIMAALLVGACAATPDNAQVAQADCKVAPITTRNVAGESASANWRNRCGREMPV